MSADPLGTSLATAPPVIAMADVADLLARHYGISGDLAALTSERDLNIRVTTAAGRFVLKFANSAEPCAVTDFQIAALVHLEASALPVPRVIRSLAGETALHGPFGMARLLTYLDGAPMFTTPNSPQRCANMGRLAARLATGLRDFHHKGSGHVLLWDIKHATQLRPLLPMIDADHRALATECLDRFDRDVAPRLALCRMQVAHNDLNQHNLLVNPAMPDTVIGVLDFGDMVHTHLICDAAVALCYQIDPAAPLDSLTRFARAYHTVTPLTAVEAGLLRDLAATRMLTSLAIASARVARYPENAAYILRNLPAAAAGLAALANAPRQPLDLT